MDIIVTTPKSQMAAAAQEAANCIANGGGEYFRRFEPSMQRRIRSGERVYYVEDGYIRGFAIVSRTQLRLGSMGCDTTGRVWPRGFYVFIDAKTWQWIEPMPMTGFRGFRYAEKDFHKCDVRIVGGWLDPKPPIL